MIHKSWADNDGSCCGIEPELFQSLHFEVDFTLNAEQEEVESHFPTQIIQVLPAHLPQWLQCSNAFCRISFVKGKQGN